MALPTGVLVGGPFGYYPGVDSNSSRFNPKAPPPGLNFPVSMGPIVLPTQPQPKAKRRWGFFLVWTVIVFAGGGAAGFGGKESIVKLASQLGINLASKAPSSEESGGVTVTTGAEAATTHAPSPAAPSPQHLIAKVEPMEVPALAKTKPEPEPVKVARAASSSRPTSQEPGADPQSGKHPKGNAKSGGTAPTGRKAGGADDPFKGDDDAAPAKPAAAARKSNEEATTTKSEPAKSPPAKSASKSSDSLDSLMVDMPSDGKGKKRDSRDIDALLKDVQKPRAEPAPKKEVAAPPAAPLSAADISRVMSGVKVRSKDCANRLGDKGVAELKITVAKSGTVSDVHLGGKLANTAVGTCIEKVTRAAVFPPSSGLVFDYRVDAR